MIVPFDTVWHVDIDRKLTNKIKIRVSGLTAHKEALRNYAGSFGGVDWSLFIGRDLEVETDGDTMIILGIY